MATMTLDELVSQLAKAYGDALVAVVLYGSAASGEQVAKRSDTNVLVIVRELPLERLRAASAVARAWADTGNPPPLTMTLDEWRASADIFPMEYADVLERHRVLHGALPTDGISVKPDDLRLQLEHQAMGKLLALRQGVLAAADDERRQLDLLGASLSTIMVIFRGVLRLLGERPPADYPSLTREVASRAGFDAEPVARVVRHVRGEERLDGKSAGAALGAYLGAMEQLVKFLDRYTATSSARPG